MVSEITKLVDRAELDRRKEDADMIREFADQVENGDIKELIIVANNRTEYCFERFGTFRDKWHMLGALEYAKTAVFDAS